RHPAENREPRTENRPPTAENRGLKIEDSNPGASEKLSSILHPPSSTRSIVDHPDRVRIADSVETALKVGGDTLLVQIVGGPAAGAGPGPELTFSQQYACPVHGPINLSTLEPRDFSFNNPNGACPTCAGLGVIRELDPELVIPD